MLHRPTTGLFLKLQQQVSDYISYYVVIWALLYKLQCQILVHFMTFLSVSIG